MLYLYAIADQAPDVRDLTGFIGDGFVFQTDDLTVVGCTIEQPPEVSPSSLLAQDRLVRELHARVPALLPMRFGSTSADYGALRGLVQARAPLLREQLDRVRGREQMTLRLLGAKASAAERPPAASGREYLEQRAARIVPAEVAPLVDALKPHVRGTQVETAAQPGVVASVYHLIDRGSSDAYRAAVDGASRLVPALAVRVSGPSPAYAFAAM